MSDARAKHLSYVDAMKLAAKYAAIPYQTGSAADFFKEFWMDATGERYSYSIKDHFTSWHKERLEDGSLKPSELPPYQRFLYAMRDEKDFLSATWLIASIIWKPTHGGNE